MNKTIRPRTQADAYLKQRGLLAQVLFGLLALSTLWSRGGPMNTALSDALLLAIAVLVVVPLLLVNGISPQVRRLAGPPIAVLAAMVAWQVLLTLVVGGDLVTVVKDTFSALYLFIALALLLPSINLRPLHPALLFFVVAGVIVSMFVLADGAGSRATGTFANPNLAGAWAGGFIVMIAAARFPAQAFWRWGLLALGGVAVILTQSFGAVFGVVLALCYLAAVRLRWGVWRSTLAIGVGVVAAYLVIGWVDSTASSSRRERSFSARTDIWSVGIETWMDAPWGIGPGSYSMNRTFMGLETELHSDLVQALVEGGFVGLGLLVALFVVMWRRGGLAVRAALIFFAGAALWRDAMNFRFLWLFVGLGLALDYWTSVDRQVAIDQAGGTRHAPS